MLESRPATPTEVESLGLQHRVHVPDAPPPRPLVVLVHGRAGHSGLMWVFSRAAAALRPLAIAPEATVPDEKGGFSWWPVTDRIDTRESALRAEAFDGIMSAVDRLERFVLAAEALHKTDPDRRFIVGFSQGAALAATLSLKRPDLFRGVALLAGFLPHSVQARLAEVQQGSRPAKRYFIAHGTSDAVVPFARAEEACEWLSARGAEVTFHSDPVGHKVGSEGIKALGAWFEGFGEAS